MLAACLITDYIIRDYDTHLIFMLCVLFLVLHHYWLVFLCPDDVITWLCQTKSSCATNPAQLHVCTVHAPPHTPQPDPGLTHLTVVEQWNMLCHITILLLSCWILWTRVWSVVEWWQTGGGRSVDDAWHLLRWNMFELSPSVQDYNVNIYISSLENIASDLIFWRTVSLLQDLQWYVLHHSYCPPIMSSVMYVWLEVWNWKSWGRMKDWHEYKGPQLKSSFSMCKKWSM